MKALKRTLTLLLTAAVMTAAIPYTVTASETAAIASAEEATGSTEQIGISTAEGFLAMESGKSYYLENDIDFAGKTYVTLVATFNGVLDGRGHALKNFSLANGSTTTGGHMGVFGKVCDGGYTTVRNLVIGSAESPISMTNHANADGYHGFLAGQVMSDGYIGYVENVTVYGSYTNTVSRKYFAGGIFGYAKKFVMTGCTVNGSLTDAVNSTNVEKDLGGLVGLVNANNNRQNVMENCTNNAAISVVGTGSVRAGGLVGFSGSPLKIENCTNTAAVSGTAYAGGLVGDRYGSDLYIKNSSSTGTVAGTNKGALLGGSEGNVGSRYLYITGCGAEDTKATEITTLEGLQGMTTAGGVYKLMNDLNLEGKSFDHFVFTGADGFNGVFDGNGHTIYNFTVNGSASSDAGFFNKVSGKKSTLITNLTLGTAENPAVFNTLETGGKTVGVLVAACVNTTKTVTNADGKTSTVYDPKYSTLIENVDIRVDLTHTGGKANLGGFIGISRAGAILNSTFSGSINANMTGLGSNWINCAAFVADVEADQTLFYNCANYADIDVSTTAGTDVRVAGLVGYATKNNEFIRCANFGNLTSTGGSNPAAAGLQVHLNGTSKVLASDCTNFGNVSAKYASGFFAWAKNPVVMVNAVNFGTVTGTTAGDAFYNDNTTTDSYTVTKLSCTSTASDLNFAMLTGASVRLETPAGLRFQASLNTEGLYWERLTMHTGTEYGMLIAPSVFVTNASAFTREALDAYAKTLGYTDTQSTYVTVPNTNAWFAEQAGSIAGSLVNIQSGHYDARFSGLAYLDLTVNGQTVRTLYASDAQSRSVKEVAAAALADVLYRSADGTLYSADGSVYTGSDVAGYTNTVKSGETLENVAGTFDLVSPYTEAERTVLSEFAN